MDALCRAKAKTNRRGRAGGAAMGIDAAKAVQTKGQERGGLRAPLRRRHARRVVEVGRCHGTPTGDVKPVGSVPLPSFRCIATRRSDSEWGRYRTFQTYAPRFAQNTITVRPISRGTSETDHSDFWPSTPCAQPSLRMPRRREASYPGHSKFRRYGGASI